VTLGLPHASRSRDRGKSSAAAASVPISHAVLSSSAFPPLRPPAFRLSRLNASPLWFEWLPPVLRLWFFPLRPLKYDETLRKACSRRLGPLAE
jgi:hypothetical protein